MAKHANDITPPALTQKAWRSRKWQSFVETNILAGLSLATLFSVFVTAVIIIVLAMESYRFFNTEGVTLSEFFLTTVWSPRFGSEPHFGIWPLICGTMLIATIALLVAIPLGLITAIYLSEYAHPRVRAVLKPTLEILAGIPTVVYGYFALVLMTPGMQTAYIWIPTKIAQLWNLLASGLQSLSGINWMIASDALVPAQQIESFNALAAGIAVGILILPIISSLSEDALRAVPQSLRDGALGVGGTKFDSAIKVVFPAALSGIISSILLAGARAIGETMIVAMAAGLRPQLTADPRGPVLTMTGYIVNASLGDLDKTADVDYFAIYAVALTLFTMTFVLTIVGAIIRKRFREVYE